MLLLAYLRTDDQEWQAAQVSVRSIVDEEAQRQDGEQLGFPDLDPA
jgi:hypothetical protein